MLLEILIAGNVMIGPNLCQVDYMHNGQLYTAEYKCHENGTLQRGSVGMPQSTKYSKQ
jgi:hypothetical protein